MACSRNSCLGLAEVRMKCFTLVCCDITTLFMTTASLSPQTASGDSIATQCTISIVSTLATPNLDTTRMSHFLLHPWSLSLQVTSKFSCSYEFHALSLTMAPYLAHPTFKTPLSLPSFPTHWLSTTRGGVKNLPTPGIRQENLELTAFLHSLDNTRNTKMLYCPHPPSTLLGVKQPRTK